ncbi:hypothetical protein KJA14_01475 [Patescibacteria group bacterium]|nr:hypothetical protein [Patescibacteria group bacterium]
MEKNNKKFILIVFSISAIILSWPIFLIALEESITLDDPSPDCIGSEAFVGLAWTSTILGDPDYYVLRKIEGEVNYTEIAVTKDTFYTDNTIDSDKNYLYQIRAERGEDTFFSNEVLALAPYCPPVLSPPTTSCKADGPYVTLNWSSVSGDISTYEVYRDGSKIHSTTDTIYEDGPDIVGTSTYNYFIRAIWQDGMTKNSEIIPQEAPACPPTLNVSASCKTSEPGGPYVSLSWNELLGIQNYQIYRKAQAETEFSLLKTLNITSYDDNLVESLANTYHQGGKISYYVKAIWETAGKDSNVLQIDIPRCSPFLKVESNCEEFSMRLSWTATLEATHYNIYRGGEFLAQNIGITNTTYIDYLDLDICPGQVCTHTYYVEAIVPALPPLVSNSVTKDIDCATIVPPSPPPVLDEPEAFCVGEDTRISISWTPSDNVVYYTLYRNEVAIVNLLEISYVDSAIETGYEYTYYVIAYGKGGTSTISENSQTIKAVGCIPPSFSTLTLSTTCEEGQPVVNLSWTETTNTFSYEIHRGPSAAELSLLITFEKDSPEFSSRTWKDTGVSTSTTYYYKVVSNGPKGVPPADSNIPSITTPSCLPTIPVLTLTRGCEVSQPVVNLSWSTDGANTTRYEIFRRDYSEVTPIKIIYNIGIKNWKDTSVSSETTYNYKVEAVGYLDTIRSTQGYKSITTYNCALPGAFTLSDPTVYCQGSYPWADLTWTDSSNATSYDLYQNRLNPDDTIAETTILSNVTSPFTDRGFGNALSFDGYNDYVNVPISDSLKSTNQISIEAWIYPLPCPSYYYCRYGAIVGRINGYSYSRIYINNYNNNGQLIAYPYWSSGSGSYYCYGPRVNYNQWNHVVYVYDGSYQRWYLNGSEGTPCSRTGSMRSGNYSIKIGDGPYSDNQFKGKIDEVRIYGRALNLSEISEHYQGNYPDETDPYVLRGLWHFDEGSGTKVSDSSNHGNNGTIYQASWTHHGPQSENRYTWQVEAVSSGGSTFSNATDPALMPTCEPTKLGLVLTPLCLGSQPIVDISWSFAIHTESYEIYREDKGLIGTVAQTTDPSLRILTDDDVLPLTSYTYWVKAIGPNGLTTESDHLNVTTLECFGPTQPQNLTASFWCSDSYPQVTLSWEASENTDYYSIYKNGAFLTNTTATSYSDSAVSVNTTYSYYVVAYGQAGSSPPSEEASITTDYCPPSTPSIILLITDCENFIPINNISWSDATTFNTTSYEIYRNSTIEPPIMTITSDMPEFSSRTWKDNLGLSSLASYTYWVKTIGPAGGSSFSAPKSIETYSCGLTPTTPSLTDLTTACCENTPCNTLTWTDSQNAYSYNVYRTNPDNSTSTYSTRISPFTDKGSYALEFDRVDDYVRIPASGSLPNSLKPANATSIEAWIYPSFPSSGSGYIGIVDYINGYYYNKLYIYYSNNVGYLRAYFRIGGNYVYRSGPTVTNNTWTHIAYVYDGTKHLWYKNGIPGTSSSRSGTIQSSTSPIRIGRYSGYYFKGKIDEVRIYGQALKAEEIQKHYQGIYDNEADLRGAWHFDEGTNQITSDSSNYGNNGTLGASTAVETSDPRWVIPLDAPTYVGAPEQEKLYKYYVKAFGVDKESSPSNELSITTLSCLPAKPNLIITPQCEGTNPQLLLSWDLDPEDLTEYWSVYKRREGEATFTNIINISPPTTSFADGDVESGINYEYYLVAVGKGESIPSDAIIEEAPFCYEAPSKPVITVAAACYGYSSRILIEWGEDPTGYTISFNIWRKNITLGETEFSKIYAGLPATTIRYLDIVDEENTFVYKVEAVGSGEGNTVFSDPSTQVTSSACSALPPNPSEISLNFYLSTGDIVAVSLYWTDAGNEEYYKLFRRSSEWIEIAEIPGEDNPEAIIYYVDYTVVDGQTYEYQVFAYNVNAPDGIASNIIEVSVPIAVPGNFTLSGLWVGNTIRLTWTEAAYTNAGGPVTYTVLRDSSVAFESPTIICENISVPQPLECDDNNPTFSERYYKAVATNLGGSTDSNIIQMGFPVPIWKEIVPW